MMISCNSSPGLKKEEKPPVLKSKATYYNPVTQKWQPGDFMLHHSHLEFVTENSDEETRNPFHLSLPLATLSSVEKRKSSFLFAAIVIRVGSEMHWFSSFPNRNAVYNNLDLFWRDSLLGKSLKIKPASNGLDASQSSSLGQELLSVLCNSEKHLVDAASALEEQGRQLYDAEDTVDEMNADLSVVEMQLNALFFEQGMSLPTSVEEVPKTEKMRTNILKWRYDVTFLAEKVPKCCSDWKRGILVISDNIALLDERDKTKFSVPSAELKSIKVLSPWELCIIVKECYGETSCRIMCPMLSRILRVLSMIPSLRDKVVYTDEDGDVMNNSSSCSSSVSYGSTSSTPASPSKVWTLPDFFQIYEQVKKVQGSGYLTDEEIEEISSKLADLECLAVEVDKEKQEQLERINMLISDVEKTDIRANAETKKMRKLS